MANIFGMKDTDNLERHWKLGRVPKSAYFGGSIQLNFITCCKVRYICKCTSKI